MQPLAGPVYALGMIDAVVLVQDRVRLGGRDVDGNWLAVEGWLLHPDHEIDHVRLRVNGYDLPDSPVVERPDVAKFLAVKPHMTRCVYRAEGPAQGLDGATLDIEVLGLRDGRAVLRTRDWWPGGADLDAPSPDAGMMYRVAATREDARFRTGGLTIAHQMLDALRTHLPGVAAPRVLDWGCGSGRATRFFRGLWPDVSVTGCDIDAAAIAWCDANIPGLRFDATSPFPPLPYPDAAFDAVFASSVMTHLPATVQRQWLREIRRVLAPGGVFLPSVLGSLGACGLPAADRAALERNGIIDHLLDPSMDGIAPAYYYRSTYQTEAFVRRDWGQHFTVLDYISGGLTNFQDLVVLRRDA